MIRDQMLIARPPEPQPGWHDLSAIVQGTIEPLRELASERGIEVDFHPTETLRCFVDPLQIAVAVTAIIENAINASSDGGRVRVTVFAGNGTCGVLVEDRGIGFTPADREHAFDPFYSGRQAGRGLGFGLPKAWRIVTLAGGTIALESQPGRTLARIELPSGPSQPEAEPADPTTAEAKTSRRRRR
jgi:signal transduction histidine kinase